uniref:Integrase, catalytic region, zinc finger, CCHC-type, peptidase aspartic, catalytic n=1 Tax=Tanacetum cinerariifolium TaxID=118510 RepID=A0A6L2K6P9_TANCI|nr:integrase, catalytic region, zinc finger, CCHC-type, peptidase aspartic, catalytic [Tanacetum cinerariifolium]
MDGQFLLGTQAITDLDLASASLSNGDALRKCILSGPYKPTTVLVQAVAATDDSPAIPEYTTIETPMNMSPKNKAHFQAEKEAIHLILTGIGDEIYSTIDACQTAQELLARNANPLALVATAQANQDPYYQTSKSHKSHAPSSKPLIPTRSHTTTRYKGKEIAKPITRPSVTAFEEDSDPKQAQRDKDMQKNLALIRTVNVARASENVGSSVVQQSGIQCFNCKEFGHFAKECRKPKRVKDFAYHKEKMLLCKQAEQGVPLQAEQYDWLADTDEEIDEQELEAHYSYMAMIQEVPTVDSGTDSKPMEQVQNKVGYNVFANELQHSEQSESISNTCLVETDDCNVNPDSPDMCNDDIQNDQNDVESDDERVALANLKLNSISVRDSCLVALQTKQTEFEKYKAFNDRTVDYDKLERVNHKTNVSRPQHKSNQLKDKVVSNNSQVKLKKTQIKIHPRIPSVSNKMKSVTACKDSLNARTLNANVVCATCNKCLVDSNHFACVTKMLNDMNARTKKPNVAPIITRKPKSQANKSVATHHKKKDPICQLFHRLLTLLKIVQLILFIVDSGSTKHMTGNLKMLCNFVEKFLGTVCFGNDQFAPILGYRDLVQVNITINRVYYVKGLNHNLFSVGQFCDVDLEVAFRKSTCFVRDLQGNDLLTGNRGSDLYTISIQESTSLTPLCLMAKASPTQAWL